MRVLVVVLVVVVVVAASALPYPDPLPPEYDFDCPAPECVRPMFYPPRLMISLPPAYLKSEFVLDPASPAHSKVFGLENKVLRPQVPAAFVVTAMNERGEICQTGNHSLNLTTTGLGDSYTAQTYDLKNGTYWLYIIVWPSPSTKDEAVVSVTIDDEHLPGSPFRVKIDLSEERQRIAEANEEMAHLPPCKQLVFVTGSDSGMFERLENFVGSVHFWEGPSTKIIVYDFGLWEEDVAEVLDWRNVEYRKFPTDQYPPHVLKLGDECTYAFKAFILTNVTEEHECAIWLDAGIELRQPATIIKDAISRQGYFYTTNGWPWPNMFCYPPALAYWGSTEDDYRGPNGEVYLARAGGIQGYRRGSRAHQYVLPEISRCAMEPLCIDPPGANKDNFRQDQTVLNLVLTRNGPYRDIFRPHTSKIFWSQEPDDTKRITKDEKQSNDLVLYIRRSFLPKPYFSHVRKRSEPYFDNWASNTDTTFNKDEL